MSWLTIQMWLELLIAGAFGGLIGWALHVMRAESGAQASALSAASLPAGEDPELRLRMVELETHLRQERDENATLRARVSTAPAPPGDTGQPAEDDGQLAFRNRHLESRVRFLEGKIADLESEATAPKADDATDEATRLRWRNRYLEGRVKYLEEELVRKMPGLAEVDTSGVVPLMGQVGDAEVEKTQPPMLKEPKGGKGDDLKIIGGIGPKLERKLNELGVWHFDQIAAWTPAEIEWVNQAISFRGRIERENWVSQAAQLAQGVMPPEARPG